MSRFPVTRVRLSTLDVRLCGMLQQLGDGGEDLRRLRERLIAVGMRLDGSARLAPLVTFVVAAYQSIIAVASERLGEGIRFPTVHPTQLERMLAEATTRGDAGMRRNLARFAEAYGVLQVETDRAA